MGIDWRGPQVLDRAEDAARQGIDVIMSRCVPAAKADVPVATAALQGSIKVVEPARKETGGEIAGLWGSTDIMYALAVETGDFGYLKGQRSDGKPFVETRRNKGRRGSLRKAADDHYKDLAGEIARRIR